MLFRIFAQSKYSFIMRFVTILKDKREQSGLLIENSIYILNEIDNTIPLTLSEMLQDWENNKPKAFKVEQDIKENPGNFQAVSFTDAHILAPVPRPNSCRDGYAFRQHVASARRNRGVEMIPEFDSYPIFYFTNHNAVQGPGEVHCMPDHFEKLDFELEVAVILGKKGRNFTAAEADDYIAGYCIMNDLSARSLQMEEMKLNLGPAKGKDFSTVIGPWMITPDELEPYKIPAKPGHTGNNYNLTMVCRVNGKEVSRGNVGDMDWTFAEIIERCAYGTDVWPGDVIGSGTVGTGCFLELNGTGKLNDPNYEAQWLQDGDVVEMDIDMMGTLTNKIKAVESNLSLFAIKK